MENGGGTGPPAAAAVAKRCFVVSEFGGDDAIRLARKQTLKHLVRKVLEPMGYEVQRADDIDDVGQITHQIIERLLDDDLVVADLTGLNPNVFYELAVRHAARKPVVTLMTLGQTIPFDLKDVRTVFYDLHDPDELERAQQELGQKVRAIEENPGDVRNPITVARDVSLLQQSADPEAQAAGAVLSALNDLRDEVRAIAHSARTPGPKIKGTPGGPRHALKSVLEQQILQGLELSDEPMTVRALRDVFPDENLSTALRRLDRQGLISFDGHGWMATAK